MPRQKVRSKDKLVTQQHGTRRHAARHGKAGASTTEVLAEYRKGVATTPPRTKAKERANRDRSDNKKVQSGR